MPVVGVGASAGGVTPYKTLVENLRADSGIAWVLIQHMAPDRSSELVSILAQRTPMPVMEVTEEVAVAPDRIYVIAPGRTMTLRGGVLRVATNGPDSRRTRIDAFLLSLAEDKGGNCGCALLSGAGSDGTLGLKAVKEAGGFTATQTLETAEYDSMLLSATRTGLVDRELALEEMGEAFVDYLVRHRPAVAETQIRDGDRLRICTLLREATGHDFSGYKTSTVDRRLRRRMQVLGTPTLSEYIDRVEADRSEATELFRDLLISVTQFFRDPDAFAAVARRAIPKILEGKSADDEVRVWVPGCASGEEAYSLAMLLQEHADSMESVPEIRVFGTDIDDAALHIARVGRYPSGIAADVSPGRLDRFFDKEDRTYCIKTKLRETCLFAQHNVLRDPPFSRIDLISCRNVLIYMKTDLQTRLMPVFHYALKPDGFLFLGPAENASHERTLFAEVDRKHRLFRRAAEPARLPNFPLAPGTASAIVLTTIPGSFGCGRRRAGRSKSMPPPMSSWMPTTRSWRPRPARAPTSSCPAGGRGRTWLRWRAAASASTSAPPFRNPSPPGKARPALDSRSDRAPRRGSSRSASSRCPATSASRTTTW